MLSHVYNILIYHGVREIGCGEYVVDSLNANVKRFLYKIDDNCATSWCSH